MGWLFSRRVRVRGVFDALFVEGAVSKESDLLIGSRIKRWWFQLVWHPQLFVHLLYFEGMARPPARAVSIHMIDCYFFLHLQNLIEQKRCENLCL